MSDDTEETNRLMRIDLCGTLVQNAGDSLVLAQNNLFAATAADTATVNKLTEVFISAQSYVAKMQKALDNAERGERHLGKEVTFTNVPTTSGEDKPVWTVNEDTVSMTLLLEKEERRWISRAFPKTEHSRHRWSGQLPDLYKDAPTKRVERAHDEIVVGNRS
jgi:hypothetical protein